MITLHRITIDNANLLTDIAEEVFDDTIDVARLARYLESNERILIVAVNEGRIVGQVAGFVHLHPDQAPSLYVDNLGVMPAMQRQQIARQLVAEIFARGSALGCTQGWIVTDRANRAACGLYESLGAEAIPTVTFSYELT